MGVTGVAGKPNKQYMGLCFGRALEVVHADAAAIADLEPSITGHAVDIPTAVAPDAFAFHCRGSYGGGREEKRSGSGVC